MSATSSLGAVEVELPEPHSTGFVVDFVMRQVILLEIDRGSVAFGLGLGWLGLLIVSNNSSSASMLSNEWRAGSRHFVIRGEIPRFEGDSPASGAPPPPISKGRLTKWQV